MTQHTVFVYGTLKHGEPNHYHITSNAAHAKFLGSAKTVDEWPMVVAGNLKIPYLLHCKDIGKNIVGELYEVDDNMLERFDILEGHPFIYERDRLVVEVIGSEEDESAEKENIDEDNPEDAEKGQVPGFRNGRREFTRRLPYFSPPNVPRQIANNFTSSSNPKTEVDKLDERNIHPKKRRKRQRQQVECISYFMKRFRPELLTLPFLEDYRFNKHGNVKLPKEITGEDLRNELSLVMRTIPSRLLTSKL